MRKQSLKIMLACHFVIPIIRLLIVNVETLVIAIHVVWLCIHLMTVSSVVPL